METDEVLYRPHQMFETQLEKQYHQEAEGFFDNLVEKAGTDAEANKLHVKAYNEALAKAALAKNKFSKANGLKTFFIVLLVILSIVGSIMIVAFIGKVELVWPLIVGIACFIGVGLCIWGIVSYVKKASAISVVIKEIESDADEKRAICEQDMVSLNSLFDWNMPAIIMENATPIIDLDPYFSNKTLEYLVTKYGFPKGEDENTSVLGIVSGRIQGNPFVLEKVMSKDMRLKSYVGTLTITWTEMVGSGKNRHLVTRTEVLTATSMHEAPFYETDTRLIYGNDAAPHLHFSRHPSGAHRMNEKEREKTVKAGVKKLDKMEEKAIKKGDSFMKMGNDEFEVFWGATDRDHETEYRLLFTPLAQRNIMELIESPEPYGDDFVFVKDGKINSVASYHSQSFDYNMPPSYFMDYSLEACKERFLSYSDSFIKGLYFDLAPLLSIPLYQLHKAQAFIYEDIIEGNYNSYECESIANGFEDHYFRPKDADPSLPCLLKQISATRTGKSDMVNIKSSSFITHPRVDYVSVYGGDGRTHQVPVHWTEYIPVEEDFTMGVRKVQASQNDYRSKLNEGLSEFLGRYSVASYFQKGFVAWKKLDSNEDMTAIDDAKLEDMFHTS
ncbi:MAG: hypothetical protein K6B65_06065 [Bacilli bacterium]|nr:hypothetical protein [Bacilli bacterium]